MSADTTINDAQLGGHQMSRGGDAVWPYAVAILAVAAATLVRMALDPLVGTQVPAATYYFAVFFAAWYGGMGPSILALALGFLSAAYFFCEPRWSFAMHVVEVQVEMGLYVIVGLSSVYLSELMHSARRRAELNAARLREQQELLQNEIQDRIWAQNAYTEMLRRSVSVQEDERRRISRELHDQCGQELTALQLGLRHLSTSVASDGPTSARVQELESIAGKMAEEIHHLALELRPPVLDDFGLQTAVSNYLDVWSMRVSIPVDFECYGFEKRRLPTDVETALYRTMQEALTNVARHARTARVSVVLERRPDSVSAIVEDQGIGFSLEEYALAEPSPRLGLLGMRERMEAVGGELVIESTPGRGTTVYARVQLSSGWIDA
jgi:signal transduction histidine kinase